MTSPLVSVERFDTSNVLVPLVLGLMATATAVDHALAGADEATDPTDPTDSTMTEGRVPHPLDAALLGLVFVGRRLDSFTQSSAAPSASGGGASSATWDDGDLLR